MLVFTRKRDDEVILRLLKELPAGTEIVIKQLDVRGDKSRMGITAPNSISVHRREVQDAIDRENAAVDLKDAVKRAVRNAAMKREPAAVACCGGNRGSGASQCAAEDGRM